ncbi:RimK family alpha-L-glutamate ligase [Scytonema sp. NUACC26]|uniref:ATP-grasp domain-containing protein n=1 Tax=Scytonema sp. NUACC26 TaxID=3140176 RepID=UPI0034DC8195
MNILILGNSSDTHAAHLKNVLTQAGARVDYLDTNLFPTQLRMSWNPNTQIGCLTLPEGRRLKLQEIHSIFWRTFSGVYIPQLKDSYQQQIAFNDSMSALRSFMQACPSRWVNSWQAYQFHKEKPLQLNKAKQIGVTIPDTLIGNHPEEILEFVQIHEKVIFKPVYGGAHTQVLTEEHLEPKRLNLVLMLSPIAIQEYIPGTNVRSYVIGESVYSAEIRSPAIDFREDTDAELIPRELPEAVQQQSLAIAKAFMLDWTAIDWRVKPNNEYIFLEANPSPMFIHFENETGFPITQNLVNLLMN